LRHALALIVPLHLLACDKDKRGRPSTEDSGTTQDTGPAPDSDPGCDTGHLDDDGVCVPAACGTGTWGNLELDESTIYVDIAAAAGGDGSESAPFTSIQAGLDVAGDADGGLVAVAAGAYPETLELGRGHGGVHLAGRCSELVVIDASSGNESTPGIAANIVTSEVEVSGVTVTGSSYIGVLVESGNVAFRDSKVVENEFVGVWAYQAGIHAAALTMEGCELKGNTTAGAAVQGSGASITLRQTTIEDTRPDEKGGYGNGVQITNGASLDAEACELTGNTAGGVIAVGSDTSVTLRRTAIVDTKPDDDGTYGYGITATEGASLDAEACQLRGNTSAGVLAYDSGTAVTLRETTIEDTQPDGNQDGGYGIRVKEGACLHAEACEVKGNTAAGVLAYDSGTSITLLRTAIEDTRPNDTGSLGLGIYVYDGASLDAEGCEVRGNATTGVAASDSTTSVTLRETVIEDTLPDETSSLGLGIYVHNGASLDAEACEVTRNTAAGVVADDLGTSVTLRETTIEDTQPDEKGQHGYGIDVYLGANLEAEACEVIGNTTSGVIAFGSYTTVTLQDTRVVSTKRGELFTVGTGIFAESGASVVATGVEASLNDGPGIYVTREGTQFTCSGCEIKSNQFAGAVLVVDSVLQLAECHIEGTTEQENLGGGVGIYAEPWLGGPPSLSVTDTVIKDNPIAGVWLSGEGNYSLTDNTIQGGEGWTRQSLTKCGDAVYAGEGVTAWDGSSGLLLENNELLDGLGAGLFLDKASALLSGNSYADNAVDLVMQGGDCETPPDGYDGEEFSSKVEFCPSFDYATCGDEFSLYLTLEEPESGHGEAPLRPGLPGPPELHLATLPVPLELRLQPLRHEPAPLAPLVALGEH